MARATPAEPWVMSLKILMITHLPYHLPVVPRIPITLYGFRNTRHSNSYPKKFL
ncbi:MAG TPA: hypothetical protein VF490_10135 [Chryseosolibacter sp.]